MPLDADVAELVQALAASQAPALSDGTVEVARANYFSAPTPALDEVAHIDDAVVEGPHGPIPIRVYSSTPEPTDQPIIVMFHGGGWVLSSVDGHDHVARRVASVSNALVVSVDYRLAPEHPFPQPHDDCWAVTEWMSRHGSTIGGDATKIIVLGDSAGANLAAGVALRARDEGLHLRAQVLCYPCVDTEQDRYPSMTENATGYFLTAADMHWFWGHYLANGGQENPYAVPARAESLAGVAPSLTITAEFDPLRDEGADYAARLVADGTAAEYLAVPGVVHGFIGRWHTMSRAVSIHDHIGEYCTRMFE
jgi:acetyl esterase